MIKRICVHHTGGMKDDLLAPSQYLTVKQISDAHFDRWPDLPSRLRPGCYVGYNFVITKDGFLTQTRYIGEETAAATGFNFDTIHIALCGNFDLRFTGSPVEAPSFAQVKTLRELIINLMERKFSQYAIIAGTEIAISATDIVPHRALAKTHCFGNSLPDNWAKNLYIEYLKEKLGILVKIYQVYLAILELMKSKPQK